MKASDHLWKVSPKEAGEIQRQLRSQIRIEPFGRMPQLIAGADVSLNLYSTTVYAGFITLSYPELVPQEESVAKDITEFPYIPGLLSFREIPGLLKAWDKLKIKPELIIVDGAGIAHPRRLGIAAHLGLVLDVPTIGCAKSRLTGTYEEPGVEAGSFSYLYDQYDKEEIIGAVVRTKKNVKPLFISPGHRVSIEESIRIILSLGRKHRLPEATRLAHETVNKYRRADLES